jgi:hypothetical protein
MFENIAKLLTEGLKKGFAGGTFMANINRSVFSLESSHLENENGIYHDEWFAKRAGGGQEIVKAKGVTYTRVYAGGEISLEELNGLGISEDDVMKFLKKQIIENGEKTRLHTDFQPEPEGDWQYSYKILDKDIKIPVTVGKEAIKFKEKIVFIHYFILCPVD